MPSHSERIAQTEKLIIDALVDIGATKSIDRITISDLTRKSGISRGTFYLHYLDKADLITQTEQQLSDEFQLLLDTEIDTVMDYTTLKKGEPYHLIRDCLDFIAEHKALFKLFFGMNGDPVFYAQITTKLQNAILNKLQRIKGTAYFLQDIPQAFSRTLITNAIMSIVKSWLNDEENLSQQDIAKIIMRALYLSPYDLLDIKIQH